MMKDEKFWVPSFELQIKNSKLETYFILFILSFNQSFF